MAGAATIPGELARLRRAACEFMRQHAASAWEHEHDGDGMSIILPPDLARLPAQHRYRAHARHEAARLAAARLYDVDAEITAQAVVLAAAIRQEWHHQAVKTAGRQSVAATMGITAPARSGFMRWRDRDGIGYNGLGAPVVACHWGPVPGGGTWLAWWADGHVMATAYAAQAQAAGRHLPASATTRIFGPLWYDHQDLLRPARPPSATATSQSPDQEVTGAWPDEEAGTPGLVLLYTTLATWRLLASPAGVDLSQQPVPPAEKAADRAAGLRTEPVIIATAARTL